MVSVPRSAFPKKYVHGPPPYDLPLFLLAQLAVDRRFAGDGLGHALISEAFRISLRLAREVGCRCIITDAYRDQIGWYARYGFLRVEGAAETVRRECFSTCGRFVPPSEVSLTMLFTGELFQTLNHDADSCLTHCVREEITGQCIEKPCSQQLVYPGAKVYT